LRKIIALVSIALFIFTGVLTALDFDGFTGFISGGDTAVNVADNTANVWKYAGIMLLLMLEIVGMVLPFTYKSGKISADIPVPTGQRRLSKRTIAAAALILLAIPLTVYIGVYFFGGRRYYFTALLVILVTMLPFALMFESRKPQARELVIIAVLCGIGVAGRTAFFMLPQFKPVVAVVIISGVALGGETGFLVGAVTGFVSNMFFGQGPWTPFQMFSFGIIGFLAGILFRKGLLRRDRISLSVFGGIATFVVYGGIMNPANLLAYQSNPTGAMVFAAYLQGIPFDLVHAAATVTFMLVISQAMLEKIDRIKVKYGLLNE
jgi:energy-coupling factor transport system ATP-binding protein